MADETRLATKSWIIQNSPELIKGNTSTVDWNTDYRSITKLEALNYLDIDLDTISAYTDNQCLPRGKLLLSKLLIYLPSISTYHSGVSTYTQSIKLFDMAGIKIYVNKSTSEIVQIINSSKSLGNYGQKILIFGSSSQISNITSLTVNSSQAYRDNNAYSDNKNYTSAGYGQPRTPKGIGGKLVLGSINSTMPLANIHTITLPNSLTYDWDPQEFHMYIYPPISKSSGSTVNESTMKCYLYAYSNGTNIGMYNVDTYLNSLLINGSPGYNNYTMASVAN